MNKKNKNILTHFFLLVLFCSSVFGAQNVTLYIDELVMEKDEEKKALLSVYGSSESEDFDSHRWQKIVLTIEDGAHKQIQLNLESDKRGLWESEYIDVGSLSDGDISISAVMKDEGGTILGKIESSIVKDTSFKLAEYLKENLAMSIFLNFRT